MSKTDQDLDLETVAKKLRGLLVGTDNALGSDDFGSAAMRQLTPRPDHPQPCRQDGCRPCAYARALLAIHDHLIGKGALAEPTGDLVQRPEDLRRLAADVRSAGRWLGMLESALADHVDRWARIHTVIDRLGARGHHPDAHETMCMRPKRALEATRSLLVQLSDLPEALLGELRPELRAMGHRPPDTLFADLVRHLVGAGMTRQEIVALVDDRAQPGSLQHDYWLDRIGRALQKIAVETNKSEGQQ